ncbi:MAG: winged helix DNA-binding domain-containing protein [Pseudonocardiales bacterium]
MSLTARELNRVTLDRQMLLCREPLGVLDALRRVMALQAQHAASPYLALWNRIAGFDPSELDAAFAEHKVVKATLMRVTLHAVHAEDYPTFHAAMLGALRAFRLADRRLTQLGLSSADLDALAPELVKFAARARTTAELQAMAEERLGALPDPGVWWALRTFVPLVHAPTGGPWSFGLRPSYIAAATGAAAVDREESRRHLARRYLAAFGPASVADFAQFAKLARSTARDALTTQADPLQQLEGPDGTVLFDVPAAPRPAADTPAPPRLMAMWDSVLLAYADRSRIIPPGYRRLVIRRNGDILPTLLVDGYVAGVWRPVAAGIQATAFHPLPDDVWAGLAAEASSLVEFLADREPTVYLRFARWWAGLPSAEVRVLPGS